MVSQLSVSCKSVVISQQISQYFACIVSLQPRSSKIITVNMADRKQRVGILGFGSLGQHMYHAITTDAAISAKMEIAFVWNRSASALEKVPAALRITSLDEVCSKRADIVVEVSHPSITVAMAVKVMEAGGNFVVGSPTALADPAVEIALRNAAGSKGYGALYIPVGALWGAADLQAMANRNALESVTITMKKHPAMIKLNDAALEAIKQVTHNSNLCILKLRLLLLIRVRSRLPFLAAPPPPTPSITTTTHTYTYTYTPLLLIFYSISTYF